MRNWRRASRSCRNVYSAKTGRMPCLFLWMWGTYVRCFLLQRPSFPGLLFMLCVLFLRRSVLPESWGDNPGKGGQPGCNPPSPSGFSPPVPRFPPSPSPMGDDVKLHIPMMLHKTLRGEIWRLKSWEQSKNIRSPQEWGGLWKRERERKAGLQHTGIVHRMRQQIFLQSVQN